jgi:hypothetical protein
VWRDLSFIVDNITWYFYRIESTNQLHCTSQHPHLYNRSQIESLCINDIYHKFTLTHFGKTSLACCLDLAIHTALSKTSSESSVWRCIGSPKKYSIPRTVKTYEKIKEKNDMAGIKLCQTMQGIIILQKLSIPVDICEVQDNLLIVQTSFCRRDLEI